MISRELIRKIRKIEIVTKRLVNDHLAGQYHSVFKGRGMAFSEVRQYQPGDDVRFIDWNVTARLKEVFVKVFTEEREMTVFILVDMSASTFFGSQQQTKREIAAEIAAIMAFSAIRNNDRVGLIIVTDRVERFVPPKRGRKHVLRVIGEILSFEPQGTNTDLSSGLSFLARVAKRRAVTFMISDFFHNPPDQQVDVDRPSLQKDIEHALRVMAKKHDLVPITITDPLEDVIPELGLIELCDMETNQSLLFDSLGASAKQYTQYVNRLREAYFSLFRKLRIDYMHIRTDQPYMSTLATFFEARQKRLRH